VSACSLVCSQCFELTHTNVRYTPLVVGSFVFVANYMSVANIMGAAFAVRNCFISLILRQRGRIPNSESSVVNIEAADGKDGISLKERDSVGGDVSALQLL